MLLAVHKLFIHPKAESGPQKDADESKSNEGSCSPNFALNVDIFTNLNPKAWRLVAPWLVRSVRIE